MSTFQVKPFRCGLCAWEACVAKTTTRKGTGNRVGIPNLRRKRSSTKYTQRLAQQARNVLLAAVTIWMATFRSSKMDGFRTFYAKL